MDEQIIRGVERFSHRDLEFPIKNLVQKGDFLSVENAMDLAIAQARRGLYFVSPNPAVGCVVLDRQGRFLASGYHEIIGGPHAEVNALKDLTDQELEGSHVIVTLEPCAHQGRTPSCARMLVEKPIGKVTYGLLDPNPRVSGQGIEILKSHGIEAHKFSGSLRAQLDLQEVCEIFLWNQIEKKPFVALKIASSLDSQLAMNSGESQWITGEDARLYSHHLRACYDSLLITAKTILVDNPRLTIRGLQRTKSQFILVLDRQGKVIDPALRLQLFKLHPLEKVIVFVDNDLKSACLEKKSTLMADNPHFENLCIVGIPLREGRLDLETLFKIIFDKGIYSVFIEAGAEFSSYLIQKRWLQRIYLFQSLSLLGSDQGQSWTFHLGLTRLSERLKLISPKILAFKDEDLLITGRL